MDSNFLKYGANTAAMGVILAFLGKKVLKKELLPVSRWKQAATTYVVILASGMASKFTLDEIEKRNTLPPKPK